jgi:pyridoxal phosphate enzyme (YggS family)
MNINNNINILLQNLPPQCKLIAVSKTKPEREVMEAYMAGQRRFGENKVQELVPKHAALPKDIEWHMIGHLQSNKVRQIVSFVELIHALDSLKLLEEIDKQAAKVDRKIRCLVQVHIAKEETKFGFSPEELLELITHRDLEKHGHVKIDGLMGMATFTDDHVQITREFASLKTLFDQIKAMDTSPNVQMNELSMGMSNDYLLAISAGSTMIRVGSAIFGERTKT